jgi:Fe-S cluster biogenesis protein NfuA
VREKIEKALDEIRPGLQADGGNVEFVDVNDQGIVFLRLVGACSGCPSSQFTLKNGIEQKLKERIPEVTGVQAVR